MSPRKTPRARKPAPGAAARSPPRGSNAAALLPAIEIAKRAVPERLHPTAEAHPPAHARSAAREPGEPHPLTEHLLRAHAATLRDSGEHDADVMFGAPGDAHRLVVQVRSGKVARVLTRA